MITVILAVYNGADTLGEQLEALAGQTYDGPWELVVADNGSTDATSAIAMSWYGRIPGLRVLDASSRNGSAAARNLAVSSCQGAKLLFCDHDDIVQPGWLSAMAAALDSHDLVAGRNDFEIVDYRSGSSVSHSIAVAHRKSPSIDRYGFLPFGLSCNLGISRKAFEAVAGFDEQLMAAYDLDICWRVQLAGFPLYVEPAAVVAKRRRNTVADVWRQHFSYGFHDTILFRRFHRHGMPRMLGRAARRYAWLLLHLPDLRRPPSRRSWTRVAASQAGLLIGSIQQRTVYL